MIGVPMHNFGICTLLKCYIDQICMRWVYLPVHRSRATRPCHGKRLVVDVTLGLDYSSSPMVDLDFQQPYLEDCFGFIGIEGITFIVCDGMDTGNRDQALIGASAGDPGDLGQLRCACGATVDLVRRCMRDGRVFRSISININKLTKLTQASCHLCHSAHLVACGSMDLSSLLRLPCGAKKNLQRVIKPR